MLTMSMAINADHLGVKTGEPNKVIASHLGVSLRTIESRRAMILKKIGVGTLPELVRMYVELETALGKPLKEALPALIDKPAGLPGPAGESR